MWEEEGEEEKEEEETVGEEVESEREEERRRGTVYIIESVNELLAAKGVWAAQSGLKAMPWATAAERIHTRKEKAVNNRANLPPLEPSRSDNVTFLRTVAHSPKGDIPRVARRDTLTFWVGLLTKEQLTVSEDNTERSHSKQ